MQVITIDFSPFKGRIAHDRIEKYHLDALEFVVDMYDTTQKLALLNISYADLQQATTDYYNHFSSQLKTLIDTKIIDAAYGTQFNLESSLDYLDLDYKSSQTFKRLLANGKVPVDHIIKLLEHLAAEYRYKK